MDEQIELVSFLAKSFVEKKDQVIVRTIVGENTVIIELQVDQEDIGRIIGKKGSLIKAIRTILFIFPTKDEKKIIFEFIEQ